MTAWNGQGQGPGWERVYVPTLGAVRLRRRWGTLCVVAGLGLRPSDGKGNDNGKGNGKGNDNGKGQRQRQGARAKAEADFLAALLNDK